MLTDTEVKELYAQMKSGAHIFDISKGAVKCLPCPSGEVEKDPCSAGLSRTCEKNGWEPLKDPKHWTLNLGKWQRGSLTHSTVGDCMFPGQSPI